MASAPTTSHERRFAMLSIVPSLSDAFPDLTFDRPAPGVVRVTLDAPGLNAVNEALHRQLADVWPVLDREDEADVVLLRGAGRAFSAGGSFELVESTIATFEARAR